MLIVASKDRCFRLDGKTGALLHTFDVPPGLEVDTPLWAYVAVADGVLVGSVAARNSAPLHNVILGDALDLSKSLFSNALFAYDLETNKLLWTHHGDNIKKNATCIADGRIFLVDYGKMDKDKARSVWETFLDFRQRKGSGDKPLQVVDKSILPDAADLDMGNDDDDGLGDDHDDDVMLDEPAPKPKVYVDRFGDPIPQVKPSKSFKVSSLALRTGKPVWTRMMDLTYCGGDALISMVSNGVLLFGGNYADNSHETGIKHGLGFYANRRMIAIDAKTGKDLWSKRTNPNLRPLITGGMIISSPYAYNLKTGKQRIYETNSGNRHVLHPWQFRFGGCGILSGCPVAVFGRYGTSSYVELAPKISKTTQMPGARPGCWINMIPASGLLVETEAASGCTCLYPNQATLVLYPKTKE